jgi:hypothetical protein
MRKLFLLLLIVPTVSLAQVNVYYTVSGNLYVPENVKLTAYGPQASINAIVTDNLDLGLSVSAIKYSFFNKPYIPISGRISLFPTQTETMLIPFFTIEPGYGIYSDIVKQADNTIENLKGDFTLMSCVGVKLRATERTAPYVAAGFSHIAYKVFVDNMAQNIKGEKRIYNADRLVLKIGVFL